MPHRSSLKKKFIFYQDNEIKGFISSCAYTVTTLWDNHYTIKKAAQIFIPLGYFLTSFIPLG
ncbi:hypothetical protein D1K53_16355 [Salmonella enterica]|uniref:Uncharacterized protein n=2 Tax=Salmonella enterica TaxID=28901 RepID=A9MQ63_SALAR|nr:hypothetical protein SARI_01305 [Salmonella enterica subsp. arizonae serovar 62:z4,z23:-]AIP97411.1 hypothetical protein N898_06415 [Salmonella enterica subsp. arizonae serovar 62:z36:- str. RKS2983]AXC77164.1 hypothetical protein DOE56_11425 [Salmonella enterica subsp. arizonae serovar 63:g,z51:-]EAA5371182.1 hypothetical protein [Salmonella enterica subsp. arizonae]EAA7633631.1 hypothetical protein [Salmonella enterica]EAN8394072.1 hypothetical protein [Salmonella enterica subsp. arizonae